MRQVVYCALASVMGGAAVLWLSGSQSTNWLHAQENEPRLPAINDAPSASGPPAVFNRDGLTAEEAVRVAVFSGWGVRVHGRVVRIPVPPSPFPGREVSERSM